MNCLWLLQIARYWELILWAFCCVCNEPLFIGVSPFMVVIYLKDLFCQKIILHQVIALSLPQTTPCLSHTPRKLLFWSFFICVLYSGVVKSNKNICDMFWNGIKNYIKNSINLFDVAEHFNSFPFFFLFSSFHF